MRDRAFTVVTRRIHGYKKAADIGTDAIRSVSVENDAGPISECCETRSRQILPPEIARCF
jgi:hypothetical protein